jgi:NifB/MoaA-like Fe-S oxidoreductase
VDVRGVANTVFGERVNVSGLLCGRDFLAAVEDVREGSVILPRPSLDYFGERFLDDVTVAEARAALSVPLAFASQWSEVIEVLANGAAAPAANATTNGVFWSEAREGELIRA